MVLSSLLVSTCGSGSESSPSATDRYNETESSQAADSAEESAVAEEASTSTTTTSTTSTTVPLTTTTKPSTTTTTVDEVKEAVARQAVVLTAMQDGDRLWTT